MDTKLTLKLDKSVIDQAKHYAKSHNMSLSRMIESYLATVTEHERKEIKITPLVESLSGVVNLPEDFNAKDDYINFLNEKYK